MREDDSGVLIGYVGSGEERRHRVVDLVSARCIIMVSLGCGVQSRDMSRVDVQRRGGLQGVGRRHGVGGSGTLREADFGIIRPDLLL